MTIAVVIPALNEEQAIAPVLAHSLSLGFDELIVVDGGSTDRTPDIVSEFQARRSPSDMHVSEEPRPSNLALRPFPLLPPVTLMIVPPGRARQMNAGALVSRSDVLLFLHADTLLPVDARHAIEEALRDSACVGGRFDVKFDPDTGFGNVISHMMNVRSRLTGIATGDQAIFVRRAAFDALGGFADIPLMEDVDFSRRLKRLGRTSALTSEVTTSFRRWQAGGPLRIVLLMWFLRFLYWIGVSPQRLSHFYAAIR